MGGVDIADQRRGYYNTQLTVQRTWMPLFFWLLDTAIVNAHIIGRMLGLDIPHLDFRDRLVWNLINKARASESPIHLKHKMDERARPETKRIRTDDRSSEGLHLAIYEKKRGLCIQCRSEGNQNKSNVVCRTCHVVLCCNSSHNCFEKYHRA
jgi:hypothetical protein